MLGEHFHNPAAGGVAFIGGTVSAIQTLLVASNTALSRFDAVSSGPMMREWSGLRAITSRRKVPSTLVASAVPDARLLHGDRVIGKRRKVQVPQ
jgi:hypothetical protein